MNNAMQCSLTEISFSLPESCQKFLSQCNDFTMLEELRRKMKSELLQYLEIKKSKRSLLSSLDEFNNWDESYLATKKHEIMPGECWSVPGPHHVAAVLYEQCLEEDRQRMMNNIHSSRKELNLSDRVDTTTEFAWAIGGDELIRLLGSEFSLWVARNQEKELLS
jgi:hypothetical protein